MVQYSQTNKHDTSYKQNEIQKSHDHIIDAEKAFDKVPIYNKNTQQRGNRGSMPQHNKGHVWKTHWPYFREPPSRFLVWKRISHISDFSISNSYKCISGQWYFMKYLI